MIALLLAASAIAAPDPTSFGFGVSGGVVVAAETAGQGTEDAAAGTLYGALGLLDIVRAEAHLGISGLGGAEGVDAIEVKTRAVDLRLLGGAAIPLPLPLPVGKIGVDLLLGTDLRLTTTTTSIYALTQKQLSPSLHPSVAAGPYFELWMARAGLRAWGDLPREGRFGVSALIGLEF